MDRVRPRAPRERRHVLELAVRVPRTPVERRDVGPVRREPLARRRYRRVVLHDRLDRPPGARQAVRRGAAHARPPRDELRRAHEREERPVARPEVAPARVAAEQHQLVQTLDDTRPRVLRHEHRDLQDLRIFRRRRRRERAPRVQRRDQVAEHDDLFVPSGLLPKLRLGATVREPSDLGALELPLEHRQVAAALPDDRQAPHSPPLLLHFLFSNLFLLDKFFFFSFFSFFLVFFFFVFFFSCFFFSFFFFSF